MLDLSSEYTVKWYGTVDNVELVNLYAVLAEGAIVMLGKKIVWDII